MRSATIYHAVMVSWWGGRGGETLGFISRCHRAHDENGTFATSWPAAPRATDGLKFVMAATGGTATNPWAFAGSWCSEPVTARFHQNPGPYDETTGGPNDATPASCKDRFLWVTFLYE